MLMGSFGAFEGSRGSVSTPYVRRPWSVRVLFFLLFSFSECFGFVTGISLISLCSIFTFETPNASIQRGLLRYLAVLTMIFLTTFLTFAMPH